MTELELGTQVHRPGGTEFGRIIGQPSPMTGILAADHYDIEWPNGTVDSLPGNAIHTRALTALIDTSTLEPGASEWTVDVDTAEIPCAALGYCEHCFTICDDCADSWAIDYSFLDPWPDDWIHHSSDPLL